jgi:hypothetical protein
MGHQLLTRTVAALVVVSAMWAAMPSSAASPTIAVNGPAVGGAPAVNVTAPGDLVSIYNFGVLQPAMADAAISAAAEAGGWGVVGRGFGIGLVRVTRGGVAVHEAPAPAGYWTFPMSVTALPIESIGVAMGRDVSSIVASNMIVIGQTSATLLGAQAGDILDLVAADGSIAQFLVGRVAPDAEVGGAEIVMSTSQADLLGATLPTSVLIYGQFDRARLDAGMAARGLSTDPNIRVRRSWDAFDPDTTISLAKTKTLLGELAYHVNAAGDVSVDGAWQAAYIPNREPYPTGIVAACNITIKSDLAAALQEVVDSGLAGYIDVTNVNTFGGCFGPRFTRIAGTQLGTLSRHTWGQPIDMNTATNCQGCAPKMDCRIVRIFRKHGFAWGGNFVLSDGMHFEWVGDPRNNYQYPSRYCPNVPSGGIESVPWQAWGVTRDNRAVMFADNGWAPSGD